MKRLLIRPLFLICSSSMLVSILFCSQKLEDRFQAYVEAHNRHDIEGAMAFHADDIRFEIVGAWVKNGKEQARELEEWDAATNSRMVVSDIGVRGDTVTFKLAEGNDWFRLAGIEEMYYDPCRMVFRGGLIREIRAEPTAESMKAFREVWQSIMAWASKERPQELSELMPGGEFVYGAESARRWMALLREWRESVSQK